MSFEVKKSEIKVKIYEKEYNLTKPKVRQVREMQEKLKADDKVQAMVDFMALLGLPKEVSEEMEIEHLTMLLDYLSDSKKK